MAITGLYYRHDNTHDRDRGVFTYSDRFASLSFIGDIAIPAYWFGRNFAYAFTDKLDLLTLAIRRRGYEN